MGIKLFSELIDVLEKVAKGFKALKDIAPKERDKFHDVMEETYRLIDTTLNMIIFRLGDILLPENKNEFAEEVAKLDNYKGWIEAEREFRLCKSLRRALRETQDLYDQIKGKISTQDWKALIKMMKFILATEGELAYFIEGKFKELVYSAQAETEDETRNMLTEFRNALKAERAMLIKKEIELDSII